MDSLPTRPANRLSSQGSASKQSWAFRRFKSVFAAVFKRRVRQAEVVPGFEGYGWCDSCEREILDDVQRGR
jgi:hypothetical protein